ncbi:MAG TPA: IS110 family transposase [Burkholderiaceae bacterium]|jgi:transposase
MSRKQSKVVRVGVDLARSVIQVHAVDANEKVIIAKQLQRAAFLPWCQTLPIGCVIGLEACCAAHYWGRRLHEIGLAPRLICPSFVTPYRLSGSTGKSDANDAEAICEAVGRPHMRFVSVKTPIQQSWLALHVLRTGYVNERTNCMNRMRGLLAEFGLVFGVSTRRFRRELPEVLTTTDSDLTPLARMALRRGLAHFLALDRQIQWCDKQIEKHVSSDPNALLAKSVSGVGVLTASAICASIGDVHQFKNGRQLSAWLGLVPRMKSTGGKERLGPITKRGDQYLRRLLVFGAKAALREAPRRDDPVSKWAVQLRERVGWSKAAVALANKNARIIWSKLAQNSTNSAGPRG